MHQIKRNSAPLPSRTAARVAASLFFFVNGATFAFWVSRIPTVRHALGLSDMQLGFALLMVGFGALFGFPLAGFGCARYGSRPAMIAFGLGLCIFLAIIPFASSLVVLCVVLFLFGICNGGIDVAVNDNGIAVEKMFDRSIMSALHGTYSLGNLFGAVVGFAVIGRIGTAPHLIGGAILLAAVALIARRWVYPTEPGGDSGDPVFAFPSRSLVAVGVIVTCAFVCEGAMSDWGGVYLHDTLHTSHRFAVAGFVVYSLAMTTARFAADRILTAWGPVRTLRICGSIAAVGFGIALLSGDPILTLIGFGCVGLGMSTVAPIGFKRAGVSGDMSPGSAIAAVATMGYSGFLIGPSLIGVLAEAISLRLALAVVAFLSAVIVVLSGNAAPRRAAK